MSKFSNDEYLMGNIDEKICIKPEYKKMLNNLLGISSRDNSTFSSSKIKNIDLYNILSEDDIQKIFTKNKFEVEISTLKNDNVILDLMESNDIDEFMEISDGNSINITITDRKLLEESFDETKQIIIEKINQNKNQIISKWKKLRNKYMDIQAQTNSWPLYVGSMFIKVRTSKATLYAPLLMKKVEIKITNANKVLIRSIDTSIDINEKLLFLLQNEYKFNLPKLKEDEDFSFEEVVIKFTSDLKKIISNDFNFIGKFSFETKKTVINKEIQYAKGTILTFAQPSGGPLRNKMIQMIQNNEVENVLDIDVLKDVQQSVLTKMKSGVNFLKITPTDISQEKAIIGSLEDSSIIWGPPGSGKSQTISNIISNLMFKNKTVIITSEKKAALDVLKNRMGVLDKYIFFGLVDKKVNKEEFYKPFQDLMNSIRKSGNKNLHRNDNSTIDKNILSFNKQKENILHENIDNLIRFHNVSNYKKGILLKHKNIIKNSIFINKAVEIEDFDLAIKECSIVKKGFIFKKYPSVVLILKKILIDYEISFEILRDFLKLTEKENITKIDDFIKIENEYLFSLKPRGTNNDIEYLNELFSRKFKFKIKELQNSERYKKRINTFIKNCDSGYRVPYKFVNIHKEIIRELFSVFVSTPQTLSAIIDMNSKYDYAIFDEASQLHLEKSIPFLGIANKSIIAGDREQMRPTSFFTTRDKTNSEDDNEENVDSLLDYAYRKGLSGTREYMLTKNYRSESSELMLFSSKEFYNSDLDTIDNLNLSIKKPIEIKNINGKWEGRINVKEAQYVLDVVSNNLNKFESIIILTFNSTQKQFIESQIYDNIKYNEIIDSLKEGNVKLRNLENIQGDEADLVVISVAYDKYSRLGSTYVARPEGRNALNVAISRAKKKMIVVKSISSKDINGSLSNKSINTLKRWLEYLEASSTTRRKNYVKLDSYKEGETFDSSFEEDVYDALVKELKVSNDYYISTQYSVGSYRIDIAIRDSKTKGFILGIEVDGYKYHSGFEKMLKDIERQKFLEVRKYPIYRITELNWKINYDKEIGNIFTLLNN